MDGEPDAGREVEDHDEDKGADVPGAANLDYQCVDPEAEKEEAQLGADPSARVA